MGVSAIMLISSKTKNIGHLCDQSLYKIIKYSVNKKTFSILTKTDFCQKHVCLVLAALSEFTLISYIIYKGLTFLFLNNKLSYLAHKHTYVIFVKHNILNILIFPFPTSRTRSGIIFYSSRNSNEIFDNNNLFSVNE